MASEVAAAVRAQYEAYPYPPRDPAEEATRLITGSPSHLLEIEHYVFGGRRVPDAPFRVLIAGCGTGDGAIMLAAQLAARGTPATIDCLDLSQAALDIVRARAAVRGLQTLRCHRGSLTALETLGLGPFDYIDCCGVLHHLDDPPAGLAALRRALAPGGGIGLMVYAPMGRAGVYETQALLRLLGRALALDQRVALARQVLAALPAGHPFARNQVLGDHRALGDAGLVDLLLHARDRAYFVPELVALADGARLAIAALIEPARYRPELLVEEPALKARLAALPPAEAWAAAELLCGTLKRHIAYLVEPERAATAVARLLSPDAIPVLKDVEAAALARTIGQSGALVFNYDGARLRFPLPAEAAHLVAALDGRRSLAELHALKVGAGRLRAPGSFEAAFAALYAALNGANLLLLRYPASRR
jgi:SAM-dependent methyltransferase